VLDVKSLFINLEEHPTGFGDSRDYIHKNLHLFIIGNIYQCMAIVFCIFNKRL